MEKSMNAYQILGVNKDALSVGSDYIIKQQAQKKLSELYGKVIQVIDAEDKTTEEKFKEVDEISYELYKYALAYSSIMTKQEREKYEKNISIPFEGQIKNMKQRFEGKVRIECENSKGKKQMQTAYQILGINDGKVTDRKVSTKAMSYIMLMNKKPSEKLETLMEQLYTLRKHIWAYNKVNTEQKRQEYDLQLRYQSMATESEKHKDCLGTVIRRQKKEPTEVVVQKNEDGQPTMILSEVGKIVNRSFFLDEGEINEYQIRTNQGENVRTIYSDIDMRRLKSDPDYFEAVKELLADNNLIAAANRFLGGYIGNLKSQEDENGNLTVKQDFNMELMAICRQYRKEHRKNQFHSAPAGNSLPRENSVPGESSPQGVPSEPIETTAPGGDDGNR